MENHIKNVFVADLKVKDSVDSIFLVKHIALMEGRDGRNYLNMVVADATGDLECRLWTSKASEISEEIKKGNFVNIKGKINQYQGRKQVVIQEVILVPASAVDEKDFVVKAAKSSDEMYDSLLQIVANLDDVYIRDLLNEILSEPEIKRRLHTWSAGKTIHHAYQSGLIEHILSCCNLAVSLSAHYQVNVNYVVAGAILHDLGKIYELSDGMVVDYTEEGKLVGHLAKGLEFIDRFSHRIKNFPYHTKMHLKHIVLSHHGSYEYGSPKVPQTSEALLVHLIDYLDSKMNAFSSIKKTDTTPGHWSGFIKHLDRIIFKGELPHYPEYVDSPLRPVTALTEEVKSQDDETFPALGAHKEKATLPQKRPARGPSPFSSGPRELKQNLGKHLQGFKIETKE